MNFRCPAGPDIRYLVFRVAGQAADRISGKTSFHQNPILHIVELFRHKDLRNIALSQTFEAKLIHKTGYPPHNITYITVNIYYFDHICPPKKLFTIQKATFICNSLNCIFFIVFFKHNLVRLPKSPFRGPLSINWSQSSPAYTVYHNPSGDTVPFILHYMYNVYCIIPICFCSPCLEAMGLPL